MRQVVRAAHRRGHRRRGAQRVRLLQQSTADGGQDLTQPQSAFIHARRRSTPADYPADGRAPAPSLIWSPRSNVRLYGDTARVTVAARLGVRIALGTDWMPSGSMNLLRELRCADSSTRTTSAAILRRRAAVADGDRERRQRHRQRRRARRAGAGTRGRHHHLRRRAPTPTIARSSPPSRPTWCW